jgi:hypothetical protein
VRLVRVNSSWVTFVISASIPSPPLSHSVYPCNETCFMDAATFKLPYQSLCFSSRLLNSWLFPRAVVFLYRMTKCWIHCREHVRWQQCYVNVIFQRLSEPKKIVYWYFIRECCRTAYMYLNLAFRLQILGRLWVRKWQSYTHEEYIRTHLPTHTHIHTYIHTYIRRPFEKFVDWRQCASVMQREAMTVMPICGVGVA